MKRKFLFFTAAIILLCTALTFTASADTGPKPSVNISFQNMGDEACYATLLSEKDSSGPARAWNGNEAPDYYVWEGSKEETDNGTHKSIWKKMVDYKDSDGYYFLQRIWRIDESHKMNWSYYPPDSFKILLYYPENDRFVSSGIYESYAFDSYYTVDMIGFDVKSAAKGTAYVPEAVKSYDYTSEAVSLIVRIIITIAVETAVAFLFSYKEKRDFILIFFVNSATQILLNVALNIENFKEGYMPFTAYYVFFEILIFAVEATVYSLFIKNKKVARNILYAFISNASSFAVGLILAHIIPGIF